MAKQSNQSVALDYEKIPPQAIDFEEAILGALLLESDSFSRVSHILKDPSVFYKEAHQMILEAIIELHSESIGIDILLVSERLRKKEKLENIGGVVYLSQLTARVGSAKHLIFHCTIITDKFLLRELIRIGHDMQIKAFDESSDPNDIAEWAEEQLQQKFDLDIEGRATFKDALTATLLDISNKQKGIINTFIKSGDEQIDENLSLRSRQICLIAGAEGVGKTKYATHLVKGILDHNEDASALWFSMEDSKEQIVRSFISEATMITTKHLQSINYTLTNEDSKKIDDAVAEFKQYDIEFVDRVCSIRTIVRKIKQFKDRFPTNQIIVIIDNLGLITTDSYYKGVEKDDYLAAKIKDVCDQTNASILLLHHMTKEGAKSLNLKDGYRPRKEHIRGSSRILDYVQQCMLLNLPSKYKDLTLQEREKKKLFNLKQRTGSFDFTRFIMEFWTINPKADKLTKHLSDLRQATWNELKFTCGEEKMPDGSKMGVGFILNKYLEYSVYIDDVNRPRETKYHKEKVAIHTFITKKMYNESYSPENNSRTHYLYGDNLRLALKLKNIFIAEIVKNRDGDDDEDHNILRYESHLGYNSFKPLT